MVRNDLRNIAIIAHVDHGKTTLVDGMLKQSGTFRENQQVATCVMDSGDLERERGITILAKNTSIHYNGVKINIIDTPGHADFSGEVERVLKMVNGVVLLVDAQEGPMPQTRFVVEKALSLGLKIIIVVNKIDKPDARLDEVGDEVLELLLDLDASDEQLQSPILYCSGKQATATRDYHVPGKDLKPLFDTILDYIPAPEGDENGELQLLVSAIDYNDYVGRIGIGRIERGKVDMAKEVVVCDYHSGISPYKSKIVNLFQIEGLKRVPVENAMVGGHRMFQRHRKHHHRQHDLLSHKNRAGAVRQNRRAYNRDELLCQRQSVCRQRRQICHISSPPRQTVQRAVERRFVACLSNGNSRHVQSVRQRRNAPFHSYRNNA